MAVAADCAIMSMAAKLTARIAHVRLMKNTPAFAAACRLCCAGLPGVLSNCLAGPLSAFLWASIEMALLVISEPAFRDCMVRSFRYTGRSVSSPHQQATPAALTIAFAFARP